MVITLNDENSVFKKHGYKVPTIGSMVNVERKNNHVCDITALSKQYTHMYDTYDILKERQ